MEFIGIPGSGKTTMYHNLVSFLKNHGVKVLTFREALYHSNLKEINITTENKYKYIIKKTIYYIGENVFSSVYKYSNNQVKSFNNFLLNNLDFVCFLYKAVNNLKIEDEEKFQIVNWFFNEISGYQLIKNKLNKDEILFFDEGFCHRILAIWGRDEKKEIRTSEILNYLNLIPLPKMLFVVNTEVNKCEERLSIRGYPLILRNTNKKERIMKLNFFNEIVKYTVSALRDKRVKIVYLENSNDRIFKATEKIISEETADGNIKCN